MNRPVTISSLWIVVMFNMAFADILSFMNPDFLSQVATGTVDGVTITPLFLLVAAVFVEIAIAMIFLSRVLYRRASRIANFVAAGVTALFVVGGGSLTPHYIFFASVELAAMLAIVVLAWKWHKD